jgi:hypothetical protein
MDIIIEEYSFVTYDIYCEAIDRVFDDTLTENTFDRYLEEGIFDYLKKMRITGGLVRVFRDLRLGLEKIARDFKLGLPDIIEAIKNKDVFGVLKAFGFNIRLMFRAVLEFTKAVRGGLLEVFRAMHRQKIFQQLQRGTMKVDEVIQRYPKLAKVTGIVVAGLLLFIWLNMTFIGDLDYDFNFSDITDALRGTFSLAELFTSPEGLMLMTLFGTGAVFGLSVPWLGKTMYNLILAIVYTGYAKIKGSEKKVLAVIHRKMKKAKLS